MSLKGWDLDNPEDVIDEPAQHSHLQFFRIIIAAALVMLLNAERKAALRAVPG